MRQERIGKIMDAVEWAEQQGYQVVARCYYDDDEEDGQRCCPMFALAAKARGQSIHDYAMSGFDYCGMQEISAYALSVDSSWISEFMVAFDNENRNSEHEGAKVGREVRDRLWI